MKTILKFILNSPKTYLPLLVIIITWGLGCIGVDITPELRDSITVVMGALAAALMRKGMVKQSEMKKMNVEVEERVDARITALLDNIATVKDTTAIEEKLRDLGYTDPTTKP